MNRTAVSSSASDVGLWLTAVVSAGDSRWAYILRHGSNDKRESGIGPPSRLIHPQMLGLQASLEALKRPCRMRIFVDDKGFGNLTLAVFGGSGEQPGIGVPDALWNEVSALAARHTLMFVKLATDSEEPMMRTLNRMIRDAHVRSATEDLEPEECIHELPRGWCDLCRSRPKGVALRGFRTRGGRSFHNDANCKFLAEGQSAAAARGQDTHEIESISWYDVSPGALEPCRGCCRSTRR